MIFQVLSYWGRVQILIVTPSVPEKMYTSLETCSSAMKEVRSTNYSSLESTKVNLQIDICRKMTELRASEDNRTDYLKTRPFAFSRLGFKFGIGKLNSGKR